MVQIIIVYSIKIISNQDNDPYQIYETKEVKTSTTATKIIIPNIILTNIIDNNDNTSNICLTVLQMMEMFIKKV